MSRPATKQLTLRFVLRTLARLRMMTRLDQEQLAKQLMTRRTDVQFLGEYLDTVSAYMKKHGFKPYPDVNCPECGNKVERDHNGARYCSERCRQSAYRKRLISKRKKMKRNEPAIRDASFSVDGKSNVTPSVAEPAPAMPAGAPS